MDLFGKLVTNGYRKKLSVYLILLSVGFLGPVVAAEKKTSQGDLVRNAVKLSLDKTQTVSVFISNLANRNVGSNGELGALSVCVENFENAVDELSNSVSQLQNLKSSTFKSQMSDVQTWISAALTYGDTCLDAVEDVNGGVKALVTERVQSVDKSVSDALGLVNEYSATETGKLFV